MTSRAALEGLPAASSRSTPLPSAAAAATTAILRQARRGGAVVAVMCGGLTALVAVQYRGLAAALSAASLTALAGNPAIRTLFGPPVGLDNPGGFTVWRTGTLLAVLVGVWAALTATRLTRGEEQAGRWDLLLAGRLRLRSLVGRILLVLFTVAAVIGAAAGCGLTLAGAAVPGAALFGAGLAGTGMVGAALGVLAAQLFPDRRSASGLAVAVLLGSLLARMVSDGATALSWLAWLTPFGLAERAAPFVQDRWLPVLVLAGVATVAGTGSLALASTRDIGGGLLSGRDRRARSSRLVTSLPGLVVHRTRRSLAGWSAGAMAYFLLIGLLTTTLTGFLRDNPYFARLADQAGFADLGSAQGYFSALYTLLAVAIGAFTASRVAVTAADEVAGRLALPYSRPVGRLRWAAAEAVAIGLASVVLAAAAGLAGWAGASWVDARLGLGEALAGALAVLPVAMLCLGAALAALGWVPSAVLAVGVSPAVGGYVLLVLADTFGWPAAVRWLSPFSHLGDVPAGPWNAPGAVGMLAVAVALAAAGCLRYARRDLRG